MYSNTFKRLNTGGVFEYVFEYVVDSHITTPMLLPRVHPEICRLSHLITGLVSFKLCISKLCVVLFRLLVSGKVCFKFFLKRYSKY